MGSDAFAVAPLLQIIQKFLSCPEKSSPVILAVKAKIKKASYFLAIKLTSLVLKHILKGEKLFCAWLQ